MGPINYHIRIKTACQLDGIYRDANMIIIEDKIRDHMPEQGANGRIALLRDIS